MTKHRAPPLVKLEAKVPPWMADAVVSAGELLGLSRGEIVRSALLDYMRRTVPGTVPGTGLGTPPIPQYGPGTPPKPETAPRQYGPQTVPGTPPSTPHTPLRERSPSLGREDPDRPTDPAGWVNLTAELVRRMNAAAGTAHLEMDMDAQRSLYERLTGAGLGPTDHGAATVEEVRRVLDWACSEWEGQMVSLQAICGPKFWQHHGRASAPKRSRRPRTDAEEREQRYEQRKQPGYYTAGLAQGVCGAGRDGDDPPPF